MDLLVFSVVFIMSSLLRRQGSSGFRLPDAALSVRGDTQILGHRTSDPMYKLTYPILTVRNKPTKKRKGKFQGATKHLSVRETRTAIYWTTVKEPLKTE